MGKSQTESCLPLRSPTQEFPPSLSQVTLTLQLHGEQQNNSTGNPARLTKPSCAPVLFHNFLTNPGRLVPDWDPVIINATQT